MNDMDVQNGFEPASTKSGTSPTSIGSEPNQYRTSPVLIKTVSSSSSSTRQRSEPLLQDANHRTHASQRGDDDTNSDAETILLPGKDGYSPSKTRKIIRHEDNSDADQAGKRTLARKPADLESDLDNHEANGGVTPAPNSSLAAKLPARSSTGIGHNKKSSLLDAARSKDTSAVSSGLSSAPASPPKRAQRARNGSDSDLEPASRGLKFPRSKPKPKHKTPADAVKPVASKRKASPVTDDEIADTKRVRRQRTGGAGHNISRKASLHHVSETSHLPLSMTHSRSPSPHNRRHRRSISGQLLSSVPSGLTQRKKRVPAPLQSTDYRSDESSAGSSPHPRGLKLRSLTTPATTELALSLAKMAPHKKHVDGHGQTFLARACAKGDYEMAEQRLRERPRDINLADNAGNTPLQIAALNGYAAIVRLLVDAGCNLDVVNHDKDTPLLDAVENGHISVVRLLLDAGVNPRKANARGEEPIDRVNEKMGNADEIRQALRDAKQKIDEQRETSEEQQLEHSDARLSIGPESPRGSPGPSSRSTGGNARRTATVRATKTRNNLLYMPMDDKTLREAAGRGDEATVTHILSVTEKCDDQAAVVAAARGGHDVVLSLLLAIGKADPDPKPVGSLHGFCTPILAAIGQENFKVVQLLLDQSSFNPTKRYKGDTYYDLARKRKGPNWVEEHAALKKAYHDYKKARKGKESTSHQSPCDEKGSRAAVGEDSSAAPKVKSLGATREDQKLTLPKSTSSPPHIKNFDTTSNLPSKESMPSHPEPDKRKKEDREHANLVMMFDREAIPTLEKPVDKHTRTESDAAGPSSEEDVKPRRKLFSRLEMRGDKTRPRPSVSSNTSPSCEIQSPWGERDKAKAPEEQIDRAMDFKRKEQMPNKAYVSLDTSGKRHRPSASSPRQGFADKDTAEGPAKKRKLDVDTQEQHVKINSPDDYRAKATVDHEFIASDRKPLPQAKTFDVPPKPKSTMDKDRKTFSEAPRSQSRMHKGIWSRNTRDADVEMRNAVPPVEQDVTACSETENQTSEDTANQAAEEARETRGREQEMRMLEKTKADEAERERIRLEVESARRASEERKRAELEQRLMEENRQRDENERKQREAEEQKKRDSERRKQLQREAAEAARREAEEEERQEKERALLASLPPLLRWLHLAPNPKEAEFGKRCPTHEGVRYDCLRPEAIGTPEGRELWILNTSVALLLGEKDLQLSRYPLWKRTAATWNAKNAIWGVESSRYALTEPDLFDLGRQFPGYYGPKDPARTRFEVMLRLSDEAWPPFEAMDLFFVKVSDFMALVPSVPHLQNVKLILNYRELPVDSTNVLVVSTKFRGDPTLDYNYGSAPGPWYYVNGVVVGEKRTQIAQVSSVAFPEKRVPRRGLNAVHPSDPEYAHLCREQGLEHLLRSTQSSALPALPNSFSPLNVSSHDPAGSSIASGPDPLATVNDAANGHDQAEHPITPSSDASVSLVRPPVNDTRDFDSNDPF